MFLFTGDLHHPQLLAQVLDFSLKIHSLSGQLNATRIKISEISLEFINATLCFGVGFCFGVNDGLGPAYIALVHVFFLLAIFLRLFG